MNLRDYLKIKEAAALLGVAPNTLRNWERAGKFKSFRHPINGYRLYKRTDLEAVLRSVELSIPGKSLPSPGERKSDPSHYFVSSNNQDAT